MRHNVYYGEYTLAYWIQMLETGAIVLPEYQRGFVWKEEAVKRLVESIRADEFVPPVTIGAYHESDRKTNYILDGQQRLTSLLLLKHGIFLNEETWQTKETIYVANDPADEESQEEVIVEKAWTYPELLRDIVEMAKPDMTKYHAVNYGFSPEELNRFLHEKYLGFSYFVPDASMSQPQIFASIFRNINHTGISLSPRESRESLYYWDTSIRALFSPSFSHLITIQPKGQKKQMVDFVRYLSIISQCITQGEAAIAAGGRYPMNLEQYYEDYIFSIVKHERQEMFGVFDTLFPNRDYAPDMLRLATTLNRLDFFSDMFDSIVPLDVYMFGLVYHVLFMRKEIDMSMRDALKQDLDNKIAVFLHGSAGAEERTLHARSPSAKKYVKERVHASIEIYGRYIL